MNDELPPIADIERIRAYSPLINEFLRNVDPLETRSWQMNLVELVSSVEKNIEKKHNQGYQLTIGTLSMFAGNYEIFDPKIDAKAQVIIIHILNAIGYETQSLEDNSIIMPAVINRLLESGVANVRHFEEGGSENDINIYGLIIRNGYMLRIAASTESESVPSVFEDFIKTIDLDKPPSDE